jgi:hypothetical protein
MEVVRPLISGGCNCYGGASAFSGRSCADAFISDTDTTYFGRFRESGMGVSSVVVVVVVLTGTVMGPQ